MLREVRSEVPVTSSAMSHDQDSGYGDHHDPHAPIGLPIAIDQSAHAASAEVTGSKSVAAAAEAMTRRWTYFEMTS